MVTVLPCSSPKMMSATSEDSGSNFGTNDDLGLDESGGGGMGSGSLFASVSGGNSGGVAVPLDGGEQSSRRGVPIDGLSDGGSSRTPGSLSFGMYADSLMSGGGPGTMMHQIGHDSQLHLDGDMLGFDATEEQRYCFCNDISYGDMIACDGANCPREWFHYGCVNLVVAPKGSWFCRDCKTKHRQRRG